MVKIGLGSAKIMHGETKTFSVTLNEPGTITMLSPAPGTREYCLGTLASLCAAYGRETVNWNVFEGQIIKQTNLPFTVTVSISFEAWKGEYYGDQFGEPAPDMGVWFYPSLAFEPVVTPPPPPEEEPPYEEPPYEEPPEEEPPPEEVPPTEEEPPRKHVGVALGCAAATLIFLGVMVTRD